MGLRATLLNHIPACSSAFNCGDRQGSFGSMSELSLGGSIREQRSARQRRSNASINKVLIVIPDTLQSFVQVLKQ